MLELCGAVGASVMAHHPGKVAARPAPELERLHRLERETLRAMGDVAAGHGVTIAVENLFVEDGATYTPDPVRLAKEVAAIEHPNVCGLLDFSHAYIMSRFRGLDFREAVGVRAPGQSSARARLARASDHDRPVLPVRRADRLRHGRSAPADGLGRSALGRRPAGAPGAPGGRC